MIILLAIILFPIALLLDLAKKWAIGQKVLMTNPNKLDNY